MDGYYSISKQNYTNGYYNFEEFLSNFKDVLTKENSMSKIGIGLSFINNQSEKINKIIGELLCYNNIHNINIPHNKLTTFPKDLCKLTNLCELNLIDNYLITIPNEICKLTNLKILYVYDNCFTCFPKVICKLKNLEKLYLYNGNLKIPFEIRNLQKLQIFDNNEEDDNDDFNFYKKSFILYDLQNLQHIKDKKLLFRLFFIIQKNIFKKFNYKIINNLIKF
jgi:Leucine-rich repeat (LRR) protein